MSPDLQHIPAEILTQLPPEIQKWLQSSNGDDDALDNAAQAIDDALFDEEAEIHDALLALESEMALKGRTDRLQAQKEALTRQRDLLRRALDFLDAEVCSVERTGAPTLSFMGRLVAEVSSKRGAVKRWVELRLYRTQEDGRYVGEEVIVTTYNNEENRRRVLVTADEDELKDFLGAGRLALDLYAEAGIIVVTTLE